MYTFTVVDHIVVVNIFLRITLSRTTDTSNEHSSLCRFLGSHVVGGCISSSSWKAQTPSYTKVNSNFVDCVMRNICWTIVRLLTYVLLIVWKITRNPGVDRNLTPLKCFFQDTIFFCSPNF